MLLTSAFWSYSGFAFAEADTCHASVGLNVSVLEAANAHTAPGRRPEETITKKHKNVSEKVRGGQEKTSQTAHMVLWWHGRRAELPTDVQSCT